MSDGDQTAYGKTNHTMDTEEVLYHYIISLPFSLKLLFFSSFFNSFISTEIIRFFLFFFLIREATLRSSTSIFFNYLKKKEEFPPLCSLQNSDLRGKLEPIKIIRKHDIRRSIFSYSRGLSRCDCDFDDKFKKIFLPVLFLYFLF